LLDLVYGVTNLDGSGYNRMDDDQGIKSKVGGAIINGEYRSQVHPNRHLDILAILNVTSYCAFSTQNFFTIDSVMRMVYRS